LPDPSRALAVPVELTVVPARQSTVDGCDSGTVVSQAATLPIAELGAEHRR
jgi:hypothetical protein